MLNNKSITPIVFFMMVSNKEIKSAAAMSINFLIIKKET